MKKEELNPGDLVEICFPVGSNNLIYTIVFDTLDIGRSDGPMSQCVYVVATGQLISPTYQNSINAVCLLHVTHIRRVVA